MPNSSTSRLTTFEVGYKGYYHEHSEWYTSFIEAESEQLALRKFAKERRIKPLKEDEAENWRWEDGDWFMALRYIRKATVKPCPHCGGIGVAPIAAES